jgi:hypothetical protein
LIERPANKDKINYTMKNNNIVILWIKDTNSWIGTSK